MFKCFKILTHHNLKMRCCLSSCNLSLKGRHSKLCPLHRLQDVVDAMRLLCDPQRLERRGHRFRIVTIHAAHDAYCSTIGGAAAPPRLVVTEAPPAYQSWTSDSSFPHG